MPFTAEPCRQAATILAGLVPGARNPEEVNLCSRSLREIADACPHCNDNVEIAAPFISEAERTILDICASAAGEGRDLEALNFSLLECIAVFAKAHAYGKTTRQIPPAQAQLMRYFETSGEWRSGDGNLATHYYYTLIPQWYGGRAEVLRA